MELERFIEHDVVEFLNKEQEKQVQIKEIREDEVDLFDIDRDYVKDMELELEKGKPEKAKAIFDELKRVYNRIPLTDPKKKKVYAILKEAFEKLKAYVNKNTNEVSLIDEIKSIEQMGFLKGKMPEKINLKDSVFAHETEALLREGEKEEEEEKGKTVIKEATIRTGSLKISDDFIKNMAKEIKNEIPMGEASEATKIIMVQAPSKAEAEQAPKEAREPAKMSIGAPPPTKGVQATSTAGLAASTSPTIVPMQTPTTHDPAILEIKNSLNTIAEHLTNKKPEQAKEEIEGAKIKLKQMPSSVEKKVLSDKLKEAHERIKALVKEQTEKKKILEKQRELQRDVNKIKASISYLLKNKNIRKAKAEFKKLRILFKNFPAGEERRDLFEDINLIHSEINALEDLISQSKKEEKKMKEESKKIKEQELKELRDMLKDEIEETISAIDRNLAKDDIKEAVREYRNLRILFKKYHYDQDKPTLKEKIVSVFKRIEKRNDILLKKHKEILKKKVKKEKEEKNHIDQLKELFEKTEMHIKKEELDNAERDYEKANNLLKKMPPSTIRSNLKDILDNLHNKIINIKTSKSRIEEAEIRMEYPKAQETVDTNTLYLLGLKELFKNHKTKAAKIFRELLAKNPNHIAAKIRLKEALS